ncbi:MAG: 4-(cytidine 5'-diphospho)-2-C-methyl-D-erythritol kinase [Candidatus Azotimanducaceae bacterium]|uniref:4-diphosphocytidyl-2-C-methyl-D-erythritol kinase n=1 Tax=OM182 bacterium TaxID=2510334 RepID=A0A520S1X9_9GAMM|nr:4-(cytidine 5'-diphospho)-2-C-methyl-D-erythritol kinase [Gammaproteobacteria bacterium]RZO76478.1 MAG: 4-(cytidine 5'-diphospho)-2-C-methyl-D-erythritol kinase [OM182 bacterium]
MRLNLPAPAKLNLFLHVLGQRLDGYHKIQSAMCFLKLADTVSFREVKNDIRVHMEGIRQEDNLVYKAAMLLSDVADTSGVEITVHKCIPKGAGLGGGSSDAATTLHGLNLLWKLGLQEEELVKVGLQLGADVPFFLKGFNAFAEGIGEELTPIELAEAWYLILVPECNISTAQVFQSADLTRDTSPITIARFLQTEILDNDCETSVRRLYPEVGVVIDWLRQQGAARMTGTGSCIFIETNDEAEAQEILSRSVWQGFVTKSTRQSILMNALSQNRKSFQN